MKIKITSLFLVLLLLISVLTACGSQNKATVADIKKILGQQTTQNDVNSENYEKIAENEYLELQINKDTTHFKIIDKKDGKIYSSLPSEVLDGSIGVKSLFDISYLNESGISGSMSSFEDCVSKGQYKITKIDNGAKIEFSLGNINEELFCPTSFSIERFEEILGKIEKAFDKSQFKSMYYKVDIEKVTDSSEKSKLLSKYPKLKEEELYVFKNDTVSLSVQRKINDILVGFGYDENDYKKDMENSEELQNTQNPVFNIPLYLTLDKENFKVTIPSSEVMEYYKGTLLSINLLKYFNSPTLNTKGYFLLPDASGSVMNFYNGKNDKQSYSVSVYGRDYSIKQDENIYRRDEAYLPIYATVTDDSAVFYNITSGESLATINAAPGDSMVNANVYTSFQFRQVSQTYLSSSSKEQGDFFNVTQKKIYDGDMELSMKFFDKDGATLNSLASYYRNVLFGNDNKESVQPLMLEFIGVDRVNSSFMGVSTKLEKVYTTIPQVLDILKELNKNGVDKMSVTLSGYFGHGLSGGYAADLKLNKKVGTDEDLENLRNWAKKNNTDLYFDIDTQYLTDTSAFGFSKSKNVISTITKEVGKDYGFNTVTYQQDTSSFRYILNNNAITKGFDNVISLFSDLKTGFSLTNIGSDLNSNFKESNPMERQESLQKLEENVKKVNEKTSISTKGANAWALKYVTESRDIPMTSMQFDICDSTVPFLQMVIKGNVYYGDEARNITGNTKSSMLDTLRTGGALSYILTADDELTFTKTDNKKLTSTKYSVWKDIIITDYKELKDVEKHSKNGISDTVLVENQLYKTTYNDGYSIIVNYSTEKKEYNSLVVEPFGYILVKGE